MTQQLKLSYIFKIDENFKDENDQKINATIVRPINFDFSMLYRIKDDEVKQMKQFIENY